MRTDPRRACANTDENLFWAIVHDLLSHPLMALTLYSGFALRFHDWTSHRAWPRVSATPVSCHLVRSDFGTVEVCDLGSNVWSVKHPNVHHCFVTNATTPWSAARKAGGWFRILADEFGGDFGQVK